MLYLLGQIHSNNMEYSIDSFLFINEFKQEACSYSKLYLPMFLMIANILRGRKVTADSFVLLFNVQVWNVSDTNDWTVLKCSKVLCLPAAFWHFERGHEVRKVTQLLQSGSEERLLWVEMRNAALCHLQIMRHRW